MSNTETIKGTVTRVRKLKNPSNNGFVTFDFMTDKRANVVCAGTLCDLKEGENLELVGEFKDSNYGRQFKFNEFKRTLPTDSNGIRRYLSSDLFEGIGLNKVNRIISLYEDDTLKIIKNDRKKLLMIQGITQKDIDLLYNVLMNGENQANTLVFLQKIGLSQKTAQSVYSQFKEQTQDIITKNPYRLTEFYGIGFETADIIALKMGIEPDSKFRIKSAVMFFLKNLESSNGHLHTPKNLFVKSLRERLRIKEDCILQSLAEMEEEKTIVQGFFKDNEIIGLYSSYDIETKIAKKIIALSKRSYNINEEKFEKTIDLLERQLGKKLASKQKLAVKEAAKNNILVITGGPGVGKTLTTLFLFKFFEKTKHKVVGTAPTGKAAKRMSQATETDCKTTHRLLEVKGGGDESSDNFNFNKNESNHLSEQVIIADESSMYDIRLFYGLVSAVSPMSRLILVGDVDQLPSVGPGSILKDLINSGVIPIVVLDEIFRQAQDSFIVSNAHAINKGLMPVYNKSKDFYFIQKNGNDIMGSIERINKEQITKFNSDFDIIRDVQILTPMKKGDVGVDNLNALLQQALNPYDALKKEVQYGEKVFRVGDKVMQMKNNYELTWKTLDEKGCMLDAGLGIFNGDTGYIQDIDYVLETIKIDFDGKIAYINKSMLNDIDLAYAITIHKSQGSEYPVIIMPISKGPDSLLTRNLLYTSVTRAKILVILIGEPYFLQKMILNNNETNRNTSLSAKLRAIKELGTSINDSEVTINSISKFS